MGGAGLELLSRNTSAMGWGKGRFAGLYRLPNASEDVSRRSVSDRRQTSPVRAAARLGSANGRQLRGINEAPQPSRSSDDLLGGEPLHQDHGTAAERTIPRGGDRLRCRRGRVGQWLICEQLLAMG